MTVSLDAIVDKASAKPEALLRLARVLLAKGDGAKARDIAMRALKAAPGDPLVAALAGELLNHGVPDWHFSLVRDRARNQAYDAALRRVIRPGMRVLDIGSGTGLLAMMAARAGATDVVTCEMNPPVAEAARQIIAKNGFADRIRVIAKNSSEIDAEADMGGRADLLVSEIVSNDMVAEDALPAHEQAFRRLLKPNAIVIPAKGVVRVALAEDRKIGHRRMTQVEGFDVTPFNMLAPPRYRIPVGDERLVLKSAAADALLFDFQSGGPFPESRAEAAVTANAEGANGIVQWIRLDMDGQGHYEDAPAPGTSSAWATQFHPFPDGFRVAQSETIRVICEHDRHRLRIWPSREKP